ncbi:uncharacterized protein LOC117175084 isoform X2 [Belonocnema kinseyi]|uniref:uncharacterized protein LOC117175084 isoform X2 n=1 Tax=Belonocnema kinseyi TaxID=2817044 RepID=UPI00143D78AA|nr:uncharacterized protein LOC117175084 isoform X2 [Belonocnema kinseyi]
MKLIFFLSIVPTIFTLGKTKDCYSCIVDSEDHNKTSLSDSVASIALVVGDTIPTEYCNVSEDLSSYTTCSTSRFCVKGVIENSYGETLLLFCQGKAQLPYLKLDNPKQV